MSEVDAFECVIDELKKSSVAEKCDADYLEKMLRYNRIDSSAHCGIPLINVYKTLAPSSRQTNKDYELFGYLSIAFDMFYSAFAIVDDMIDNCDLRHGRLCWYRVVGVGAAANDSQLTIATIFFILKKHFSHLDCYTKLVELVGETMFVCGIGQHFNHYLTCQTYESFTEENYDLLQINNSSSNIYIIFSAILYFAGISEPHVETKEVLMELGYLIQVQNDYQDCYKFMDSDVKSGTDIEEKKCTWLAVQCLKLATQSQREVFCENYGKKDKECVSRIKKLYEEINLNEVYVEFIEERCSRLKQKVRESSKMLPEELLTRIIDYLFTDDLEIDEITKL